MGSVGEIEEFDLVVVGAGVYGLPIAKTYLEVHPTGRLLVLDGGQTVGGTWSRERLYDGLSTNNLIGVVEYPDFPMDFETYGVPPGSPVPGTVVHRYLTAYAERYDVFEKIRFGAMVKTAELDRDATWILSYDLKNEQGQLVEEKLVAKKMVWATGTTSKPNMPRIKGEKSFDGHVFHSKELSDREDDMDLAKNVVILGGSKSAADAVYMNASKGRHVDWVIRASGKGPAWLSGPYVSPANIQFEKLATTRLMTFLSPCFDMDAYPTIRSLLHNTRLGRAFLRGFFAIIQSDMIGRGKFHAHPETKKLIPDNNVYWSGTSVGIFNYPTDLFELIRNGLVHVHRADITSLSHHTVHLSDGNDLKSDILIYATGWKHTPTIPVLPSILSSKIGTSSDPSTNPTVQAADAEIMRRFPELRNQPSAGPDGELSREQTSYVLYRGIVPPAFLHSRNLAYCGITIGIRGFLLAHMQALWIIAFMDDKLSTPLPSEEEAAWQAMLQNRFYRWRAPNGLGPKSSDMVFEVIPFIDTLLRDLGLETARKGGWRELLESYGVADYPEIVQEWLRKEKKGE